MLRSPKGRAPWLTARDTVFSNRFSEFDIVSDFDIRI